MQLPDWLDFHADARPLDMAIVTPRAQLTYGQLRQTSIAAAVRLRELGIKRGQTAAIFAVNPALQCALLLGLHRLGVTACILPQEAPRRQAGLETIKFDWLLTDSEEKRDDVNEIPVNLTWLTQSEGAAARMPGGFSSDDEISLILMSSATTSNSKPIGYTVAQIEKRIMWRGFGEQGTHSGEKTIILAGLASMIAFHVAFGSMWGGGTVYIGWDSEGVLPVIAQERIARLFASAPLLLRTINALEAKPIDCSSLRLIYAGGDSIPPALARRVMNKMCRNLLGGFGTNETGQIAVASVERMGFKPEQVGFMLPWAQAEAVDENDVVLPHGSEGLLRFKSASTTSGYINNPEANAAQFKDGWFYPGDMGWVTREGMLIMSGRRADFIHTQEGRFNPAVIDNAVAARAGIVEAAGFGVKGADGHDEIWLAVVSRANVDVPALREFCADRLGARAPQQFLVLPKLPRNEGGKVLRRKLSELAVASRASGEPVAG